MCPAYFDTGFVVREPAWHELGVVLDEYPGREEAMRLAGHDFTITEEPVFTASKRIEGFKALRKQCPPELAAEDSAHGKVVHVVKESYGVVQNTVGWDIVDALVGEGALYETGITMKDGAVCSVLAWLDEPVIIDGDDSPILPYVNVSWAHDGSASLTSRPTSVRVVCWNTQTAAEAQGKRTGTEFTFRHTSKVMDRIEDAKMAMRGVRQAHAEYVEVAAELATLPVNRDQRNLFVSQLIPMPPEALVSKQVVGNVERARASVQALFDGPTIPDAHRFTGYGLHLAGGEYLDHLRGYRSSDTYFGRQMLRREPAKAKLTSLIKEVVNA